MKKNGFRRPFHRLQIATWICLTFFSVCFYSLIIPALEDGVMILMGTVFTSFLLLVVVFGFLCTFLDPSDPALTASSSIENKAEISDYKKYPKICKLCDKYVNGASKHCQRCQRCVCNFDHHCKWVNNCIGEVNYKIFVILICNLEILIIIMLCSVSLICRDATISDKTQEKIDENLKIDETGMFVYFCFIVIIIIISAVVGVCNGQLILFHVWLKIKDMTTYEFLMMRKKSSNRYRVSDINVRHNSSVDIQLEQLYEPYIDNPDYNLDITRTQDKTAHTSNRVIPFDVSNEVSHDFSDKFIEDGVDFNPPSVSDMNSPRIGELNQQWNDINDEKESVSEIQNNVN